MTPSDDPHPDADHLNRIRAALPAYSVGAVVGRGAHGMVFEGRHLHLDRQVAIKQLATQFASDAAVRRRFLAEAQLLATLDHPHIVPVYDFVDDDGLCLLVMEFLPAGSLTELWQTKRAKPDIACATLLSVCAGLQHAHERGVLHRDVKPDNLMFSGSFVLKITDFGIAKVLGAADSSTTIDGTIAGTPAYIAPEQARGASIGPPVDVYAAGTVLYELLAGRLPFPEDASPVAAMYRRAHEVALPLTRAAPSVPAALAAVTDRALSTSPNDRYGTAEEFGIAIASTALGVWGPGWLDRPEMPRVAAGPILDAARGSHAVASGSTSRATVVSGGAKRHSNESSGQRAVSDGTTATPSIVTLLFVEQVSSNAQLSELGDLRAESIQRALFEGLRDVVTGHGGREVEFTGDRLFASFDGASQGADAAVEMQQLVAALNRRRTSEIEHVSVGIGVHIGEPLVRGDSYFGQAVAIGRGLCDRADGGQIVVSNIVHALVSPRGTHAFRRNGDLDLGGSAEPIATFLLEFAPGQLGQDVPDELVPQGPFVGRRPALAWLEEHWQSARAGRRSTAMIHGDVGIGKTSVAGAFAAKVHATGGTVWYGRAGPKAALSAWSRAIETFVVTQSAADLRLDFGQQADDLVGIAPVLATALKGTAATVELGADRNWRAACDALVTVVNRVAGNAPLLIILDNLGDADNHTLETIRRLAIDHSNAGRLMLLGLYRSPATNPDLTALVSEAEVDDLELRGLDREDVIEAIETFNGSQSDSGAADSLLAESHGDPKLVMQAARARAEQFIEQRVVDAVQRVESVRTDMRLVRDELSTSLRELDELRLDATWQADSRQVDAEGTPPLAVPCPYQGLTAFQTDDAEWYYGRESLVAALSAKLASASFVGVVGASGSGKSSLVRAGLLPALASGSLPDSGSWLPVTINPGSDPLGALAEALCSINSEVPLDAMKDRLRLDGLGRTAADVVRTHRQSTRLLLLIDQFEEIFTTAPDEDALLFMDLVAGAVPQTIVVVTLRADFYGHCGAHPGLAGMLQDSQVLVGPMTRAALHRAITAPARAAGLVVEPGLPEAIIFDANDEPGLLPLVSTALLETWKRRRGRSLTLAGYSDAGGVRGAIAMLAENVYASLDDAGRRDVRRILMRLSAPGEDRGEFRRRVPLREIADSEASRAILATLADRRLVTVDGDSVEVAHEALFREWPRLRVWLTDDREGRRLHHQIAVDSGEWERSGRESALLLRGSRMAAAVDFASSDRAELNEIELDFVDESRRHADAELAESRRTARRLRGLLVGAAVVLVVAIVAGAFAFVQRGRADREANRAEIRRLESRARDLASRSESVLDPYARVLLAIESEMTTSVPSTESRSAWADASVALADQPALLDRAPLTTSGGAVTSLSWNPSNSAIAIASADGSVALASADARPMKTLVAGEDATGPSSLAWSPDGTRLAVATADSRLSMFDADGNQTAQSSGTPLISVDDRATSVLWNPSGAVAAVSNQAGLTFVDRDGHALTTKPALDCVQLGWNRAGNRLVGLCNRKLDLFDADGQEIEVPDTLSTLGGETSAARWSPVNGSLAVYNTSGGVIVIDATGDIEWMQQDETGYSEAILDWSADGAKLAVQEYYTQFFTAGRIRVFDGGSGAFDPANDRVTNESTSLMAWSPTDHLLAIGASDGSLEIDQYGATAGSIVVSTDTGPTKPQQLAWDASGSFLAAAGADGLTLFAASGQRLGRVLSFDGGATTAQWNAKDLQLATGDRDGTVRILRPVLVHTDDPELVEFSGIPEWSPDSRFIVGTSGSDLVVADPALQPVTTIPKSGLLYASSRSWSADSSRFAIFDLDGDLALQDAHVISPNGDVRFTIENHSTLFTDQINYLEWAHHRNDLLVTSGHALTVYDADGAVLSGPIEIGGQVFGADTSREFGSERYRRRDVWSFDDSMIAVLVQDPAGASKTNVLMIAAGVDASATVDFGSFDPNAIAWGPASDTLAVGGQDGTLRLVTSGGTRVSDPIAGGSSPIVVVEWLGGNVLTKDAAGVIRVHAPDGHTISEVADLSRCGDPNVAPSRTAFIVPCGANTLHIFDTSGHLTGRFESSQNLGPPEWAPVGSTVAVIDTQGRLQLVESDGRAVGDITPFTPSGTTTLPSAFWAPSGSVIEGGFAQEDLSVSHDVATSRPVYAWSESEACQYLHQFFDAQALDNMLDLDGEKSACGSSADLPPIPLLPVLTRRPDSV